MLLVSALLADAVALWAIAARLERWQTNYLPVDAAWAAIVLIVFPPLFGYV